MLSSKFTLVLSIFALCSISIDSEQYLHSPLTQYINRNVQSHFNYLNFFEASPITDLLIPSINLKEPPIERAKYFTLFASAGYCSHNLITWKCHACQKIGSNVSFVTDLVNKFWNTKAFVAHDIVNKEIIVTFRGGLNLQNFLGDYILEMVPPYKQAPAELKDKNSIKLHSGFRSMTLSLYPEIISILKDLLQKYQYHHVVIVGHSLGGALATLTLFYLKYENVFPNTRFELYTYGSPRVGNQAFVDFINNLNLPVARVVEKGDLYAHFIPTFLGYLHHGNELFIYNVSGSSAKYCSRIVYEDSKCSNSLGPYYNSIDHLRYFDTYMTTCFTEEEPWEALLQFVFPIRAFLQPYMKPQYVKTMLSNIDAQVTNSIRK